MRLLIIFCIFAGIFPASADISQNQYSATVVKVIDGDTVKLDVNIWVGLTQRINLRLLGINTPEKRGKNVSECEKKAAQKATNFTQNWLRNVDTVIVSNIKKGKYAGRALGSLSVLGKGDLGKALIDSGNAKKYDGGKRAPWC
jgi:endonuclease YncB( thermonuclease family)